MVFQFFNELLSENITKKLDVWAQYYKVTDGQYTIF